MLAGASDILPNEICERLWAEAANTATDLDGILVGPGETVDSTTKFFGKGYKSNILSTKIFGEECIVANAKTVNTKIEPRGRKLNWVGYAKDHPVGTYRLFNPASKKIVVSRDVTFLRDLSKQGASRRAKLEKAQDQENAPTQPIADQLVHNSVGQLDSIVEEDDGEEDEESDLESLPSLLHEVSSSSSESESSSSDSDSDGEVDSDEESMPDLIPPDEQESSSSDDSSDEEPNYNSRRSSGYNLRSKSRAKQNRQSRRKSAKISAERKTKRRRAARRARKHVQSVREVWYPYFGDETIKEPEKSKSDSLPRSKPRTSGLTRALRNLDTSYNPEARKLLKRHESQSQTRQRTSSVEPVQKQTAVVEPVPQVTSEVIPDNANVETGREEIADVSLTKAIIGTSMMELIAVAKNETDQPTQDKPSTDYIEPKSFDQAWNHPDPEQRHKWREAIGKEYNDMKKHRVWRLIKRRDMPSGRR